jgi:branched-chain amino acid transport system substrate-binding protein
MHSRFFALAILVSFSLLPLACSDDDDDDDDAGGAFTIGALLPLTGALSSYGETSHAALDEAIVAINAGSGPKVRLLVEDTTTVPAVAAQKLAAMKDRGVRLVIGPYSSAEVREVKSYADANGIVLISPLSTSTVLAVPNDNILRFTPDDAQEGVAVATLAYTDGVRAIIPVTRDDEGNKGLQQSVKGVFEAFGGRVLPGLTYPANETEFTDEARTIAGLLQSATAGGEKVAIYLTAFAEVTNLFAATTAIEALRNADWIGSDSVALSKDLIENAVAAGFAAGAGYPNPILGLADADRSLWQPVSNRVRDRIGREPDAFALAAYDGLVVGHEALEAVGVDESATTLRDRVVQIALGHQGLTGSTALNAAGDRALATYDFWAVCRQGNGFAWRRVASYNASTGGGPGSVTRMGC